MNYLASYYKNLAEQLQQKVFVYENFLTEQLAGMCSSTDISSSYGGGILGGGGAISGGMPNDELYPPSDETTDMTLGMGRSEPKPKVSSSYIGGMLASPLNMSPKDTYGEFMKKSFSLADEENAQKGIKGRALRLDKSHLRNALFSMSDEDQQKLSSEIPDVFAQDIIDAEYEQGKQDLKSGQNIQFGPVKTQTLNTLERRADTRKDWLENNPWETNRLNKETKRVYDPVEGKIVDRVTTIAPSSAFYDLRGKSPEQRKENMGKYVESLLPSYEVTQTNKSGLPGVKATVNISEPTKDAIPVETRVLSNVGDDKTVRQFQGNRLASNSRQIEFDLSTMNIKQLEDLDKHLTGRIQGLFGDIDTAGKQAQESGSIGAKENQYLSTLKKEDSIRLQNRVYNQLKMKRAIESGNLQRSLAREDAANARWRI